MIKVKRALISVSDKTGLIDFAQGLHQLGIEIVSTGGTAESLKSAGIAVKQVSDQTGFPEILDGRVKTLHPAIHGGLLALREKPAHMEQLKKHHIEPIDMVVVNLYPFEKVTQKNVSLHEVLENIDIGGPSMLRSAAKNFKSVAVISKPSRYKEILDELNRNSGLLSDSVLAGLAVDVFEHTAHYDRIIHQYLNNRLQSGSFSGLPKEVDFHYRKLADLRYGENPHQKGAFYSKDNLSLGLASLKQLHGKELSFNNILDLNAAVTIVRDFEKPAAVIIKHNNPTGIAEDDSLEAAYQRAYACDKVSAFGGIIGLNQKVNLKTAQLTAKSGFMECIIAPEFDKNALKLLSAKKNIRLITVRFHLLGKDRYDFKPVDGGLLLQEKDNLSLSADKLICVTKRQPGDSHVSSLLFGWKVIKHIRSNAVILVKGTRTVGIGCGQTSRVESTRIAIDKAGRESKGAILVSDAFIPKPDNVVLAQKAGIKVIIQTGGSVADQDVIKAADKAGIAMVMTGVRHFKH